MKPSEVIIVKAKTSSLMAIIPFNFLMWKGKVLCDEATVFEFDNAQRFEHIRVHETIHARQAYSIHPDKWMPYYKEYLKEWFGNLRLLSVDAKAPYMFMPMELEAYAYQYEKDYLNYANGEPRPAKMWQALKTIPKKRLKELAKEWYKGDKKNFSEFVINRVFNELLREEI